MERQLQVECGVYGYGSLYVNKNLKDWCYRLFAGTSNLTVNISHILLNQINAGFIKLLIILNLKPVAVPIPEAETQNAIVVQLDGAETSTQQLESSYQRKLEFLAELKQSILQKAFTGELTADKVDMEAVA